MNRLSLEKDILSTYLLKSFILTNGISILLSINKSDSIISILISFIIGIIFINIFSKDKNEIFSKISLPIKLILIICVITFSSQLLYSTSKFIKFSLLNNVDIAPIGILFIMSCIYLSSKGINTILKAASLCFYIFIFLELVSIVLITPNIDSTKILPLFTNSFTGILKGSFIYTILSVSPIYLLKCISFDNKKRSKKIYIFINIYLLFNILILLSVVDKTLAVRLDYPEIFILSKISLLNFFDRLESILSFKFLFDLFFTITMSIFYIKKGLISIFKNIPYADLLIGITVVFMSNTVQNNNYLTIVSLFSFLMLNTIISIKK